jgi:hypothetical protein
LRLAADFLAAGLRFAADFRFAGLRLAADFLAAGLRFAADFRFAGFRLAADFLAAGLRLAADFRFAGFRLAADFLLAAAMLPPSLPFVSGSRNWPLRRHALQAPPFPFAHTAPHAVSLITTERVVEALDPNGTLAADPLGLPR